MKIYTKAGDGGETYLASGIKVKKTDSRVDLYGTCDELNSFLGLALTHSSGLEEEFTEYLSSIQHLLFEIGSELAGYVPRDAEGSILTEQDIENLEKEIDRLTLSLPPIKNFILPGGSEIASTLHIARTVCRRLERDVLRYVESQGEIAGNVRKYINRLSDYLFTAARYANLKQERTETTWKSRTKK
ncbi:cob(I)yrinic acid a,c-diamide adenosyltransferase [Leptospira idonii]|uniref:Corrinoid adenosyltransferase n=1 Tax=Leptospira idonii TaxID=1193500 RepID=A0A4R9LWQ3_9LEPT|nr:cob(I)yrinic acid a,c-diamide adenosyltransferase [Leptospira idonii]TGN18723.1 cob(I)yrinic acid a,c-diamide adenosyltransferase [Leptospira idonii]